MPFWIIDTFLAIMIKLFNVTLACIWYDSSSTLSQASVIQPFSTNLSICLKRCKCVFCFYWDTVADTWDYVYCRLNPLKEHLHVLPFKGALSQWLEETWGPRKPHLSPFSETCCHNTGGMRNHAMFQPEPSSFCLWETRGTVSREQEDGCVGVCVCVSVCVCERASEHERPCGGPERDWATPWTGHFNIKPCRRGWLQCGVDPVRHSLHSLSCWDCLH